VEANASNEGHASQGTLGYLLLVDVSTKASANQVYQANVGDL